MKLNIKFRKVLSIIIILLFVTFLQIDKGIVVNAETSILNTDSSLGIFRDLTKEEIKSYYSSLETGMKGDELLDELQEILKEDQVKLNYSSGDTTSTNWNAYYLLDRDWELSPLTETEIQTQKYSTTEIWMNILYSTNSIYINSKINSGTYSYYDLETNEYETVACANSTVQFDREHVFPKSFGFNGSNERYKDLTAGCDIINLHASEHNGNSSGHSNYPFGNVAVHNSSTAITSGITGEIIGYTGNNANGIKVFEPLDEEKGDIARTVFYMCARYHNYEELGNEDNTPALALASGVSSISTTEPEETKLVPAEYGQLIDLLEWNTLDEVDEFEIHRNNLCYNAVQFNRNPFIDFPQWAEIAYNEFCDVGIDLSSSTGVPMDKSENGLSIDSTFSTIYKNELINFAKLTFNYQDEDNLKVLSVDDLTYKVTLDGNEITVNDLKTYAFNKLGLYKIEFTYEGSIKDSIEFRVISPYSIAISNRNAITTEYREGDKLDLSNLVITLSNKESELNTISDYSIKIYDANKELVSTSKTYEFTKSGTYTIEITYTIDNDVINETLIVKVNISQLKLIIICIIIVLVVIFILFALSKMSKKQKKQLKKAVKKIRRR